MPYYEVKCKCGHVGRNHYIPISFAIFAPDAKAAALIGRWMPRSKHHQKDCVLDVKEISCKRYCELSRENENDPYLKCHSIQEQRQYDFSDRICDEYTDEEIYDDEGYRILFMGKTPIKHPKKFMRFYANNASYALE